MNNNPDATVGLQVTFDVTGPNGQVVRIRPDLTVPQEDNIYQIGDAKFSCVNDLTDPGFDLGKTLTDNQGDAFPWIANGTAQSVVPAGGNAAEAGLRPGIPIQVSPSIPIYVNGPNGTIVVRILPRSE